MSRTEKAGPSAIWQRKTQDAVKGYQAEGLITFLRRCHEVCLTTDIPGAEADIVPDVDTAHLTCAEGDGDNISAAVCCNRGRGLVCVCNLHGRSAQGRVEA